MRRGGRAARRRGCGAARLREQQGLWGERAAGANSAAGRTCLEDTERTRGARADCASGKVLGRQEGDTGAGKGLLQGYGGRAAGRKGYGAVEMRGGKGVGRKRCGTNGLRDGRAARRTSCEADECEAASAGRTCCVARELRGGRVAWHTCCDTG